MDLQFLIDALRIGADRRQTDANLRANLLIEQPLNQQR
jgi:hypothetical protein